MPGMAYSQELGWLWLQAAAYPVTESPVLPSLLGLRNAANDPAVKAAILVCLTVLVTMMIKTNL